MKNEGLPLAIGLGLQAAQTRVVDIATTYRLPVEDVPLVRALGRVLGADVPAPRNVPGFRNSAMDGFAVRACDLPESGTKSFRLRGEILAGADQSITVGIDECVRITTGAALPAGADTVVVKENALAQGEQIEIASGTQAGANVRAADEDFRAGERALNRGTRLAPAHVAALAAFGLASVAVAKKPHAILLTTGNELTPPGEALSAGRIYDSNRFSLGGLLEQHGTQLVRHERLRDDPVLLREALIQASSDADIIVSSGGVSVGEADFMPRLVEKIGEVFFWKVRMRPGMPVLFGRIGKALIFALPGNPVSGVATFLTMVRPAIDAMTGATGATGPLRARLTRAIHKSHSRTEFQRASLTCDDHGVMRSTPVERQGSGMLSGLTQADVLVVLPESTHDFAVDTVVEVLPLPGWPH